MSRPVIGPSDARRARWSAQMTPYSARVVMRTIGRYASKQEVTRPAISAGSNCAVGTARNTNLRHFSEIQDLVDLIVGKNVLAFHEIANENVLFHRLFAELRSPRISDLWCERSRERGRAFDPVLTHFAIRLDSFHRSLRQNGGRAREDLHRQEDVERNHRH